MEIENLRYNNGTLCEYKTRLEYSSLVFIIKYKKNSIFLILNILR